MMEEPAGEAPQNDGEQSTLISAPLKLHQIICPDFCIIAFRLKFYILDQNNVKFLVTLRQLYIRLCQSKI